VAEESRRPSRGNVFSTTAADQKICRISSGKGVGKSTGWRAGQCRHVQVSELRSMEMCNQAVVDFLAVTDVGKFPPEMDVRARAGGQRAEE